MYECSPLSFIETINDDWYLSQYSQEHKYYDLSLLEQKQHVDHIFGSAETDLDNGFMYSFLFYFFPHLTGVRTRTD